MARLGRSSRGKPGPHGGGAQGHGEVRPGQRRCPGPRGSQAWTAEVPRAMGIEVREMQRGAAKATTTWKTWRGVRTPTEETCGAGRAWKGQKQEVTSSCWERSWEMNPVSCPGSHACWWSGLGDRPPQSCLSSTQVPTLPTEGTQPSFPAAAGRGMAAFSFQLSGCFPGRRGMGGDQTPPSHSGAHSSAQNACLVSTPVHVWGPPNTHTDAHVHRNTCAYTDTRVHGRTCTRTHVGTHSYVQSCPGYTCTHARLHTQTQWHTHFLRAHPHSTMTRPDH